MSHHRPEERRHHPKDAVTVSGVAITVPRGQLPPPSGAAPLQSQGAPSPFQRTLSLYSHTKERRHCPKGHRQLPQEAPLASQGAPSDQERHTVWGADIGSAKARPLFSAVRKSAPNGAVHWLPHTPHFPSLAPALKFLWRRATLLQIWLQSAEPFRS